MNVGSKEDKRSLAHYNLLDCKLVSGIFKKTGLIDLVFKRATISGLPMDRVGMSVAAFDYFMLPHSHRKVFVAATSGMLSTQGMHRADGSLPKIRAFMNMWWCWISKAFIHRLSAPLKSIHCQGSGRTRTPSIRRWTFPFPDQSMFYPGISKY